MATLISALVPGLLKLLMVAGVALYAGLVLMSYRTDGPHSPLRLELSDPARSAERLTVWLGVRALAIALRAATGLFTTLSEASAEVGEWFIDRRRCGLPPLIKSASDQNTR
jgi:hypothetical protein